MKKNICPTIDSRGFTLVEIIITLVVAAILGTILFQYMSTSLTHSTEPITQVQKTYALNQIIEYMTADYKTLLATDSDPLGTLKTNIENGNDSETSDPYYGDYSVDSLGYIKFPGDGGTEFADVTGDNNILKAVISSDDQSITILFTE